MRYHKLKAGAEPGTYVMETNVVTEDDILTMAKQLSRKRLTKGRCMANPSDVKEHLLTLYRDYEHEVFAVLLLDSTHRLIGLHELFRGTINSAVVHPRDGRQARPATQRRCRDLDAQPPLRQPRTQPGRSRRNQDPERHAGAYFRACRGSHYRRCRSMHVPGTARPDIRQCATHHPHHITLFARCSPQRAFFFGDHHD